MRWSFWFQLSLHAIDELLFERHVIFSYFAKEDPYGRDNPALVRKVLRERRAQRQGYALQARHRTVSG
jgi:hypothetical protein